MARFEYRRTTPFEGLERHQSGKTFQNRPRGTSMSNQQQYPNHPPFEGPVEGEQYFTAKKPQPSLPDPGQPEFRSQQQSIPKSVLEFIPATSGWRSIPSPVRFAVWAWAIGVIVSLVGGALFAILMVLGVAAGLS